jgi:hypothetical protein
MGRGFKMPKMSNIVHRGHKFAGSIVRGFKHVPEYLRYIDAASKRLGQHMDSAATLAGIAGAEFNHEGLSNAGARFGEIGQTIHDVRHGATASTVRDMAHLPPQAGGRYWTPVPPPNSMGRE